MCTANLGSQRKRGTYHSKCSDDAQCNVAYLIVSKFFLPAVHREPRITVIVSELFKAYIHESFLLNYQVKERSLTRHKMRKDYDTQCTN